MPQLLVKNSYENVNQCVFLTFYEFQTTCSTYSQGKKQRTKKPMRSQEVINNYYTTYCTTSQIAKMSLWRYSWKEAVNILCKFWVKFNQQIIIKFCATHNTIHASLFFFSLIIIVCEKKKSKMGGELSPGFHTLTIFCLTAKCTYLHKLLDNH